MEGVSLTYSKFISSFKVSNMRLFLLLCISFLSFASFAQIADKPEEVAPLLIGEQVPLKTSILDAQGKTHRLGDILATQKTVLVFYRGGWCPFCNVHLSGLAKAAAEITALGYQIVAISPDDPKNLQNTAESGQLNYQLYADPQAQLLEAVGIAFKAPEAARQYIASKSKGDVTKVLPVPALLVLDKEGKILFEYISPNYKQRISAELLLAVLKNL